MEFKKSEVIITIAIIILIFSLRLPYINNAPPERGDLWRQSDTESIARNFLNHEFNILRPQFNYDGPLPNYVQLEFQITTFVIAMLYRIFGHHYYLARIVPAIFFMVSVYYLFRLIREIYGVKAAWIIIIIYGTLPINLYFSRAIMPESAALCFFNGAFFYFYKWYIEDKKLYLFISSILTALAISQKTPAVFIGLAMIFMCIEKYGFKFIKKWELWLFSLISLVPSFLYILYSGNVAEFKFVSGIGTKHIIPKFTTAFLSNESWKFYSTKLPESFTLLILILGIIGLFTMISKKDKPIIYLFLSVILEVILIVSVIRFKYYLIFLSPVISILAGKFLHFIFERLRYFGAILVVGIIIYTGTLSYRIIKDDFRVYTSIMDFGKVIDIYTNEGDLVVIGSPDPSKLSVSNRQGWRANLNYYDYIPKDIEGEVKYFIDNGARYFILDYEGIYNDNGKYVKYLQDNFKMTLIDEKYRFFTLR